MVMSTRKDLAGTFRKVLAKSSRALRKVVVRVRALCGVIAMLSAGEKVFGILHCS